MKKTTKTHKPKYQESVLSPQRDVDVQKEAKKPIQPLAAILSLIAILALLGVGVMKRNADMQTTMKTKTIPDIVKKIDPNVEVKEVTNLKEVSGMYQFELKLSVNNQAQTFTSYVTKDGKLFFTGGINVSELEKKTTGDVQGSQQKAMTCDDLSKTETPSVTAFVVSQCPYGLQMQRVMKMAIAEEPALQKFFHVKYIGAVENGKITAMHGDAEAQENLRQICIREEQNNLYWPYVSCYMEEGKAEACVAKTNVHASSLQSCMTDASRGLVYAKADFDLADKHQIGSSPTLLVNDAVVSEFDFGGRTSNALKDITCCSSQTKGAFCEKELSTTNAAVAFSTSDVAQEGNGAAANCN